MEHAERRRWCKKISEMNEEVNRESADAGPRRIDIRDLA